MKGLAGIFLRAHPPTSPLLMFYGDKFPDFLAGMSQLSHIGYLPDVARLEQRMRLSYHAADTATIDPAALGALSPEALMEAAMGAARRLAAWPADARGEMTRLLRQAETASHGEMLEAEAAQQLALITSPDHAAAVDAFNTTGKI